MCALCWLGSMPSCFPMPFAAPEKMPSQNHWQPLPWHLILALFKQTVISSKSSEVSRVLVFDEDNFPLNAWIALGMLQLWAGMVPAGWLAHRGWHREKEQSEKDGTSNFTPTFLCISNDHLKITSYDFGISFISIFNSLLWLSSSVYI